MNLRILTRGLLVTLVGALAVAALGAPTASAKTIWLCKPGLANNPCTPSLKTTVFSPWDTRQGVVAPKRVARPKFDCFYVYPTVSDQEGTQATRSIDPEIRDIALYHAARYSQLCRLYVPVYRQITVRGLQRADFTAAQIQSAYADVVAAWKTYLRRFNRGRGVVILGHSQGSYHLQELIREHVETSASQRRRLISAILLGANVIVRKGEDTGGVFKRVRACRSATQVGCVVAFSAFNETPPATALFGRTGNRFARVFNQPTGAAYEVLCTNPAALGGGSGLLDAIFPSKPFEPGTLIALGISLLQVTPPEASTPFVAVPDALNGRCSSEGGANVLRVEARNGTPEPKPSPTPDWGLHLLDANLALGNLVELVGKQARAYERRTEAG